MKQLRRDWLRSVGSWSAACMTAPLWTGELFAQEPATPPVLSDTAETSGPATASSSKELPTLQEDDPEEILEYHDWQTQNWRFGAHIEAGRGSCEGVFLTFPIPMVWPEQKVRLVDEQYSPFVTGREPRVLNGLVQQNVVRLAKIPPLSTVEIVVTLEIQKAHIRATPNAREWRIPEKPDKELKEFLVSSPYIDPKHSKIRRAVEELKAEATDEGWIFVESIYDWVREKVQYREGDLKTAAKALDDGFGDCEELTSVFVACCRAARVPARMVWVPGHCYPEFYLEHLSGKGVWFPCQVAGTRLFGTMEEYRPILQKGDRFKVPEEKDVQRYVAELCKIRAVRGTGSPKVSFIQEKGA